MPISTRSQAIEFYADTFANQLTEFLDVLNFYDALRAMKTKRARAMGCSKAFAQMNAELILLGKSLTKLFGYPTKSGDTTKRSLLRSRLCFAGYNAKSCASADIKAAAVAEIKLLSPISRPLRDNFQAIDAWLKLGMTPGNAARADCFRNVSSFARAANRLVAPFLTVAPRCSSAIEREAQANETCV